MGSGPPKADLCAESAPLRRMARKRDLSEPFAFEQRDFSPKCEPGPLVAISRLPWMTSTSPAKIMKNSRTLMPSAAAERRLSRAFSPC